jgi:Zn finger protein HypA/HybF involved in hydrogenase expression
MAYKDETKKEFVCRRCVKFLDTKDLKNGKCPNCNTDEDIYNNDLNDDDE